MLSIYLGTYGIEQISQRELAKLKDGRADEVVWFDVLWPTEQEISYLESIFGISLPKREIEDIELSAKYKEEKNCFVINFTFVDPPREDEVPVETVLFVLNQKYIATIRYGDVTALKVFLNKNSRGKGREKFKSPFSIFNSILSIEIDRLADMLEQIGKAIKDMKRRVFQEQSEEIIKKIALYDEFNLIIRESIDEKIRILSKLTNRINEEVEELKVILDDLSTLLDFTKLYSEKIDSLQNTLLGLINRRENEAVRIFTIIATVFMPATLIASIYGMNFKWMPELSWKWGYPFAIALMLGVTAGLLFWVKKKGWM